jgi:hypothetical protein
MDRRRATLKCTICQQKKTGACIQVRPTRSSDTLTNILTNILTRMQVRSIYQQKKTGACIQVRAMPRTIPLLIRTFD